MLDLVKRARNVFAGDGLVALANLRDEPFAALENLALLRRGLGFRLRCARRFRQVALMLLAQRLGALAFVLLVSARRHKQHGFAVVKRRLPEQAFRQHLLHVLAHVVRRVGACRGQIFDAAAVAQADDVAIPLEALRQLQLAPAHGGHDGAGGAHHQRRGRGAPVHQQQQPAARKQRNGQRAARCHQRHARPALRRRLGVQGVHLLFLAFALLNGRVLLLAAAKPVGCLRDAFPDALRGNVDAALDGGL